MEFEHLGNREKIDLVEACELLGLAKITLRRYVKKGILPRRMEGKKLIFYRDELLDMMAIRGAPAPGVPAREQMAALQIRVHMLERQTKFLYKIAGLNANPLSDVGLVELYELFNQAIKFLTAPKIPISIGQKWSEIFLQITEMEINRLNELLQINQSWQPFYALCMRFHKIFRRNKNYDTSIELQQLCRVLEEGVKSLRAIGTLMLTIEEEESIETRMARLTGRDIALKARAMRVPDDLLRKVS